MNKERRFLNEDEITRKDNLMKKTSDLSAMFSAIGEMVVSAYVNTVKVAEESPQLTAEVEAFRKEMQNKYGNVRFTTENEIVEVSPEGVDMNYQGVDEQMPEGMDMNYQDIDKQPTDYK